MKYIILSFVLCIMFSHVAIAQGPPITSDKPIMLGQGQKVIKTLSEYRQAEKGDFIKMPLMFHYLPSNNILLGLHLPFVSAQFNDEAESGLGDIEFLAKYQFYRKDGKGKTFRMVAKAIEVLPTGQDWDVHGISTKDFQSYLGLIAGYESIKYGISNELGFNFVPQNTDENEIRYKLGFGLPLLKPVYPVKQINLYFEYSSHWFINDKAFLLLYAQGIQYAKNQWTYEASIQLPLIQNVTNEKKRDFGLLLGTRYVF